MPVLQASAYPKPPLYLFNGHVQTIYPALTRKIEVPYERERLTLSDGDFVDLDWVDNGQRQLVILSHGLEGNSDRHYVRGMAKFFSHHHWDVLAWNCRSCSGEMNRALRLYNHGEIEDIAEVIAHALKTKDYEKVLLIGFSMGGSITIKYLGANGADIPEPIVKGIAISAPCEMKGAVEELEKPHNFFYRKRFFNSLKEKIRKKAAQFPDQVDFSKFDDIQEWRDFDNFFSAPLNGYRDADDFYEKASCVNFMAGTQIPILIINAYNDPILSPNDYPSDICAKHPLLFLETPKQGGHVGFSLKRKPFAWTEYRALEFVYS
ncbi:MAG: alpha/beta fold hydrolase [Bacteroidota bacterium]